MGTGNNSRIIGSFRHRPQVFKSGNEVRTVMMEGTQASGSNAVGPSASATKRYLAIHFSRRYTVLNLQPSQESGK